MSALWAISMAGGIDSRRLEVVMRSWASGVDGACVVLGPDDPPLPELPYPTRTVRTLRPFSRSSWRNIAVRFAPTERVMALDADCVLFDPRRDFKTRVLEGLGPLGSRRIVGLTFAWGEPGSVEHILVGGDLAQAVWRPTGYQTVGTTGQLAFWRGDAIELSWNDEMLGWGAEDSDLHWRAERWGFATSWLSDCLGHVHHACRSTGSGSISIAMEPPTSRFLRSLGPSRRASRAQNLRIARHRKHGTPSLERAICEIAMLPLRVAPHTPEGLNEGALRRLVREQCEQEGWPALVALRHGDVPEGCLYAPVLGTTILDKA